ncbi:MAG: RNA polymerase sigma factor [Polyangiales bacterium]
MTALAMHPWDLELLPAWALSAYGAPGFNRMATLDPAGAEEQRLVEAAQRGDREALKVLLDRVARPLYAAVILPRVGAPADAEDILKDTLLRAMERLETFRWTGAGFFPWVRQIAVNLVIDHVRRNQRRNRLEERLERQAADVMPLHHAGAEEALIEQQERAVALRMMESAMGELNPRYRRAIELRVVEERPREECAAEMGVTMGNFDVILHRALAALRKAYGVR